MLDYYKLSWKRWKDFSGRSNREEYWLASVMVALILGLLQILMGMMFVMTFQSAVNTNFASVDQQLSSLGTGSVLFIIAMIVIGVPNISLTVRRFRDIGLVGPYPYLVPAAFVICGLMFSNSFLAVLAGIANLVLLAMPTDRFNAKTTENMEEGLRHFKDEVGKMLQSASTPKSEEDTTSANLSQTGGNVSVLSTKIKLCLAVCLLGLIGIFYFGYKDTGSVYYDGSFYTAGSLFEPDTYTSYSYDTYTENELNQYLSNHRMQSSIGGVMISVIMLGGGGFALYLDPDFHKFVKQKI